MSSPSSTDGRRRVALLGSTGSIGRQAVDVLEANAADFQVVALATGHDATTLAEQARRLRPATVALADDAGLGAMDLPAGTERLAGDEALVELATRSDVDLVLV